MKWQRKIVRRCLWSRFSNAEEKKFCSPWFCNILLDTAKWKRKKNRTSSANIINRLHFVDFAEKKLDYDPSADGFCQSLFARLRMHWLGCSAKANENHKSRIEWHSNYFVCLDFTLGFACVERVTRQFELLIPFIYIISARPFHTHSSFGSLSLSLCWADFCVCSHKKKKKATESKPKIILDAKKSEPHKKSTFVSRAAATTLK